ncbi:MAG: metallophosphoesterase [Dehalococcoidia bacterium]
MRTVRMVVFGDTHLGFDLPGRARIERRRRGDDFAANFRRVLEYARETADVVVHLGDFFHRSRVPAFVVEDAFGQLANLAGAGIPVVIVPGNHDRSRLPASLWLGHPNIHVFTAPGTFTVAVRELRVGFAGFPFAWGDLRLGFAGLLGQCAANAGPADVSFLCMHHTVAGARVGPNGYTFRGGRDVLPTGHLPKAYHAVLSGHIHRHQLLEGDHPTVYYPGSTERTSFAEREETKGFLDLSVSVGDHSEASLAHSFVPLPARPMVDVALPATLAGDQATTFLSNAAAGMPPDAVVRVSVPSEREDLVGGLSAEILRSVFPATMNVQLAGGFQRRGR